MNNWNNFKKQANSHWKQANRMSQDAWNAVNLQNMKQVSFGAVKDSYRWIASTRVYRVGRWGLLAAAIGRLGYVYGTKYERDIEVAKSFNRLREKKNGVVENEYLIADENHRLYQVISSFWYWQWYPDELWSSLKEGQRYHIKGYGVRIRRLGIHPRLVKAKRI